jgi:hypothetical protein
MENSNMTHKKIKNQLLTIVDVSCGYPNLRMDNKYIHMFILVIQVNHGMLGRRHKIVALRVDII